MNYLKALAWLRVWMFPGAPLGLGFAAAALFLEPAVSRIGAQGMDLSNQPLKQIQPGVFDLGNVRLDQAKKTVSFPCVVNMDQGLIEYALVSSLGKLHESLLRTEAEPFHIQLAVLLLGTNSAARAAAFKAEKTRGTAGEGATERTPFLGKTSEPVVRKSIAGEDVTLWVNWKAGDTEKRFRIEDLIRNLQTKSPASRGPWIYNGSRIVNGSFLAQRDGSIIAVIEDLDALINNPRAGRENDEIWQVNATNVPPVGTAVRVTIELEKNASP